MPTPLKHRPPTGAVLVLVLVVVSWAGRTFAQEQPGWWDARWRFRKLLQFDGRPRPGQPAARVWVHVRPEADHGGRDIRVVGPDGAVLPFAVVHGTPDGRYLVAFQTSRAAGRHAVYYDNPNAEAVPQSLPARGLIYETRPLPRRRNPDSWQKAQQAIQEAEAAYGADFWPRVFDAYNPFGPQDEYLAIYRGYLNCSRSGEYRFATVSEGPSFLLVDERLVTQWLGRHNIWQGRHGEHSGSVDLQQGTHKFTYVHFVIGGRRRAEAAWMPPGERRYRVIPGAAFPAVAEGLAVECQQYGQFLCADFTFEPLHYCEAGEARMVTLQFTSRSGVAAGQLIQRYEWDFGDGQTSTESRPRHVYLAPGIYSVTLKIASSAGRRTAVSKKVLAEPIRNDLDFTAAKLNRFYEFIRGYRLDRLPTRSLLGAWDLFRETEHEREAVAAAERLAANRDDLEPAAFHDVAMFLGGYHRDQTRRHDVAEKYFELARDGVPRSDRNHRLAARLALADLYLNYTHEPQRAREECVELRADFPRADAPELRRALILIGDSYRNEAYARLRRESPEGALVVGEDERADREDLEKSLETYRRAEGAPAFAPEQPAALVKGAAYHRIEAYLRAGEAEQALLELEELLWHYPTLRLEGRPALLRVRALLLKGDVEEARRRADIYLSFGRDPNFLPALLAGAGEACAELGLADQARAYYDKVLEDFPEAPQAREAENGLRRLGF